MANIHHPLLHDWELRIDPRKNDFRPAIANRAVVNENGVYVINEAGDVLVSE